MSILNRIKTTMKADAHGVIDALEDRALLLRQHVRDAEAELARKRGRLQLVELDQRTLERDEKTTAAELAAFESDVEVALSARNDQLSRYALKAVLVRRARQQQQSERREALALARRELEQTLAEQTERYETLKERVNAELAAAGAGQPGCSETISEEQVELELLRRKSAGEVRS